MRRSRAFNPRFFRVAALAMAASTAPSARAQGACDDATPFVLEPLVKAAVHQLSEPLKMDFDMDAEGKVDIYFVERTRRLRRYDARTGTVVELGRVDDAMTGTETGLTGLALDPAFKINRRIFLSYIAAPRGQGVAESRVVRYTLGADGLLDPASKEELLAIPMTANQVRCTITLRRGSDGDLFVGMGENQAFDASSANTMDLRGKILRIRPRADKGYDIPPGNLFPPGTPQTRPEIYVMGARTAYTMAWDPVRRRLAWGEFGPDAEGARTEEHNVTSVPGFFGWPYFAGRNFGLKGWTGQDAAAPVNRNPAVQGLKALPAAIPSVHAYGQAGSVTGPLYHRPAGDPKGMLPPAFDGVWFLTDFDFNWVDTVRLDPSGTSIVAQGRLPNLKFDKPLDFQERPDGRLYVLNYAGQYTVSPKANISVLRYQGCAPTGIAPAASGGPRHETPKGRRFHVTDPHDLGLRDLRGRKADLR